MFRSLAQPSDDMTVFRGTILQLLSGVSPNLKDYKTVVFQASINSRGLLVERFPAPEVLVQSNAWPVVRK